MLWNTKQLSFLICNVKRRRNYLAFILVLYGWITYLVLRSVHFYSMTSRPIGVTEKTEVTHLYMNISVKEPKLKSVSTSVKAKFGSTMEINYLLEKSDLCTSVNNLTVLIIVHTAPSHREYREAIRRTWANNTYYSELGSVRVLFLLGRVKNESLQDEIKKEYRQYADILQGDFIDHYHNMTYKGIMAYKWLTEKCRNAKIILKVDDDVIVNMFHFLSDFAKVFQTKSKYISCRRLHNTRIIRETKSKWSVNNTVLKGQRVYPDFCQGFVVVISNDLIPSLYQAVPRTPFFWIDDVYLYGLVPKNVTGIQYNNLKYGRDVMWGAKAPTNCYKTNNRICAYLAVMFWSDVPSEMDKMWALMVQHYKIKTTVGQTNVRQRHVHAPPKK